MKLVNQRLHVDTTVQGSDTTMLNSNSKAGPKKLYPVKVSIRALFCSTSFSIILCGVLGLGTLAYLTIQLLIMETKRYSMRNSMLFACIVFICSCAPSRFVKPLNAKQQAVNLSLGGPMLDFNDIPVPMPFVTATYGYGIDSSLTGFASLNITSALYGNLQLELGATKRLLKQKGSLPGVSINPVANFIYRNKNAVKFYPEIDLNAYWDYNRNRNFFYVGISNWFELEKIRSAEQEQGKRWLVTPMIGETFVRRKWNYNVELKLVAANVNSGATVADYKTPFNHHGAVGIYFGITRKF